MKSRGFVLRLFVKVLRMTPLEEYYNKFNEDKRLNSRHGRVEFQISMKYIHKYLEGKKNPKILDVGAGTGRYSLTLAKEGYDVTAVELVQHNVGVLRQNAKRQGIELKAYKGNALKLKRFEDESFDLVLVFGPMYHLGTNEERILALCEAKRVVKPDGVIMAAYVMNEYAVLTYAFKEKKILECLAKGQLSPDFHTIADPEELYHYVRLEDMKRFYEGAGLQRICVVGVDGAADYIRPYLNELTEEEFQVFVEYQMKICERMDLMGASAHTVDILKK